MFASAIRLGSHGLLDAAEVLLIWSVKKANIIKYGKRSYHNILKKALFPQVNIYNGKNNIHFSYLKYSTEKVQSAVFTTADTYENRSTELQTFLQKHSIKVTGSNTVNPFYTIEDAEFPQSIVSVLRKFNINEPTPIQSLSWSHSLAGRDIVGISKTGSGKTLGFIIPAIIHIEKLKQTQLDHNLPLALVIVPTRELANQVHSVARLFSRKSFRCVCLYGGASRERQFREIQGGIDLCIGTPGRILDFIEAGVLSLRQCSFLVLDEADRMLDMGFLCDLEKIINMIECKKQVLMWSATWPKEVKSVAEKFLSDYIMITVGSTDLKPNPNIRQIVKVIDSSEKKERLVDLLFDILGDKSGSKILIFAETKFNVDCLLYFLRNKRIPASSIHSGKSQNQREIALKDFREGRCSVLIATAVAARGLDVDDITHVINYDCPKYYDEYIHKIGRTARHEKTGTAITFVTHADTNSEYLLEVLKGSNEVIPRELFSIARTRQLSFNAFPAKKKKENFRRSRHDYGWH